MNFDTTLADSATVTVNTQNSLLVDASFNTTDIRSLALCEENCFTAVFEQSTVPYISLDRPRGINLVHNSAWMFDRPVLHFDITHLSGADPNITEYRLTVKDSATSNPIVLAGGSGSNYVVKFTRNNSDATGLAFRMSTFFQDVSWALPLKPTGIYTLYAYIDAVRSGYTETDTIKVPLLYVREPAGYVARGWYVSGLQRLHVMTGNRVIITEPGGSAFVFSCPTANSACIRPSGDFSSLRTDGTGGATIYTRALADSTKIWFGASGQMDSIADPFGVKTRITYDAQGKPIRIYDPIRTQPGGGLTYTEIAYSASTVEIRPPQPNGTPNDAARKTILHLNADSSLRKVVDPDGDSTRFTYLTIPLNGSRKGQLSEAYDRNGTRVASYQYDAVARLQMLSRPTGVRYYDGYFGNEFTSTQGRVFTNWELAVIPTSSTMWTPKAMQRVDTIRSRSTAYWGQDTFTRHDRWGQGTQVISPTYTDSTPLRRDTTHIYRTGVEVDSIKYPTKNTDRFGYTPGKLLSWSRPHGQDSTSFEYDGFNQVATIQGPRTVRQDFFRSGNPVKIDSSKVAAAYTTRITYDALGRPTLIKDPSGIHADTLSYNATNGNLARRATNGSRYVAKEFDGYGRDSVISSHGSLARFFAYDSLNRLTRDSLAGDAQPTKYFRNGDKIYVTRIVDPQGHVHKRTVNVLGWAVRLYDPADTTRFDSLLYTPDGLLSGIVNRRGQKVNRVYDNLFRLTSKWGNSNVVTDNFSYGYLRDSTTGAKTGMITVGWNSLARDSIFMGLSGWTNSVVTRIGSYRFVRKYVPTPDYNLAAESLFVGDTTINTTIKFCHRTYTLNTSSEMLETLSACGRSMSLARDADGLTSSRYYPNMVASSVYTSRHEVFSAPYSPSGISALGRDYAYTDSLGRITQQTWSDGATNRIRTYQFTKRGALSRFMEGTLSANCPPPQGQLIDDGTVCAPGTGMTPTKILGLEYDAVGNLLKQHDTVSAQTLTAIFPQPNRDTSWSGISYRYDRDGNDTTRATGGSTTYLTFSADNRLDRVRLGSDTVLYEYNAFGQLVRRKRNSRVDRLFLWSADQLVAELDSIAAKRIAEYVYWPGVDHAAALVTGHTTIDTVRYYAQDELGNVIGVFGGVAINQSLDSDPWGLATVTGTLGDTSRVRWKGTIWEGGNTQLYYMRNRWYDPTKRRFISEDPLNIESSFNPYTFGDSDPVNFSDPIGLAKCTPEAIAIGFVSVPFADGTYGCWDPDHRRWWAGPQMLPPVQINVERQFGDIVRSPSNTRFEEWVTGLRYDGIPLQAREFRHTYLAAQTLAAHAIPQCRSLGKTALGLLQTGSIVSAGPARMLGFVNPFRRRVYIGSATFRSAAALTENLAHETYHLEHIWTSTLWNDVPGKPVYRIGEMCASSTYSAGH